MKKRYNKQSELDRLKDDNEFLKIAIQTREDCYNTVLDEKNKLERVMKELTYMLLHMDVIENLVKDDFSTTSAVIKTAINKFRHDIVNGFYENKVVTNEK